MLVDFSGTEIKDDRDSRSSGTEFDLLPDHSPPSQLSVSNLSCSFCIRFSLPTSRVNAVI